MAAAELTEAPDTPAARRARLSPRTLALLLSVAVVVYALDQIVKHAVVAGLTEGQQVPLIGDLVTVHFVKNAGAAFSIGTGWTWIFSIVAAAVAIVIVVFARRIRSALWATVFGMLLGGNLGNLTDRLFREPSFGQGHVVDFIQVAYFPAIFNLADAAICSSMVLFVLLTLFGVGLDGRRASDRRSPSPTPDP